MGNYQNLHDEELIEELRAGDEKIMDYILDKYKPLVRKKANAMYLIGGDTDDLIQEGMIGLFKAIRDYNKEKERRWPFGICETEPLCALCPSTPEYRATFGACGVLRLPVVLFS